MKQIPDFPPSPSPSPPQWFQDALANEPLVLKAGPPGRQTAVRRWGEPLPGATPVILVHGWLAHARWFDFIAPLLVSQRLRPVYAIDLPGMGDSDRPGTREPHIHEPDTYTPDTYTPDTYTGALRTAITALSLNKPYLVTHSFGALVGTLFAASHADLISGLVVADSPFRLEPEAWSGEKPMRGRYHKTLEQAMARFKLLPEQEVAEPCILTYIARHSLKQTPDGWRWKFDWNRSFNTKSIHDAWGAAFGHFERLSVPKAFIYAQNSRFCDDEWAAKAKARLNDATPFVRIDDAGHHLMLDQPHAFVRAVRTLLEDIF